MLSSKGFTIIELMIVVVIISILAAVGIPNFIDMHNRAREAAVKSNGHTCQMAIEDFGASNNGNYPPQATAMADILAHLPGNAVFDNPFTGGGGLSINTGAVEGMCDYLDPAATGTTHVYRVDCYGRNAVAVLVLSNG